MHPAAALAMVAMSAILCLLCQQQQGQARGRLQGLARTVYVCKPLRAAIFLWTYLVRAHNSPRTQMRALPTALAGDVLVVATVSNMLNIPFKQCFTVNTLWDVRPTLSGGCTVSIRVKVGRQRPDTCSSFPKVLFPLVTILAAGLSARQLELVRG